MGGHVNSVWTDEQSDALKALLAQGKSFSQIAEALNRQFKAGYSRNAVCGRAWRLQIKAPARIKISSEKRKRDRAIRAKTALSAAYPSLPAKIHRKLKKTVSFEICCAEIIPRNITFEGLGPDDCRYPFGEGPFVYCGHKKTDGSSYCSHHLNLTTRKRRTIAEAISEARQHHMRKLNFKKTLLEAAE